MTKLKNIAAISAIIFAVTLLLCLIVLPFALRSSIDTYNKLVDKSEAYADKLYTDTTLDLSVSSLRLMDFAYSTRLRIQESPDDRIHILTLDNGFSYILPEVTQRGETALVSFRWLDDIRLNEENILRALAARNDAQNAIVQLPPKASLELGEIDSWTYYHLDLEYTGFANAEELQQQLEDWYRQEQLGQQSRDLRYDLDYKQQRIQELREELVDSAASWENSPEEFFADYSYGSRYNDIASQRSELIQKAYDFLGEHGDLEPEKFDASLLQALDLADQLFAQEQELDQQLAQQAYNHIMLERLLYDEEISDPAFAGLSDEQLEQRIQETDLLQRQTELQVSRLGRQLNTVIQRCLELRDPFPETETPTEEEIPVEDAQVPAAPTAPEVPREPAAPQAPQTPTAPDGPAI